MQERYVIHVTKECNMNCFYCYEKDKDSRYTKEEVVDFVKKIVENCNDKEFGIEFLGGEPTMAFDNIKSVYSFLEKEYPNMVTDYVITTNGTILTDEIKRYLIEHNKIIYAVSMDGTRWSNQFRRFKDGTNAFLAAKSNIEWAIANLPQERVNVHIVTHPFNVGNIYNSIKFLYTLGIRSIGVGTVESTMAIDGSYCDRFVQELAKVSMSIRSKEFEDLSIDLFSYIKPKSDVRTYIKDAITGKTIGESYGRAKNDITHTTEYNSIQTSSPIEDLIYHLRKCVYENHQHIMRENNDVNK